MKHLHLLGMESEREALLKTMQDLECVEISHIDGSEEALKTGLAKPDDRALLNAQEESRAYRTALAALDRFAPEKKGLFRKRQGVSRASFFDEENERQARKVRGSSRWKNPTRAARSAPVPSRSCGMR